MASLSRVKPYAKCGEPPDCGKTPISLAFARSLWKAAQLRLYSGDVSSPFFLREPPRTHQLPDPLPSAGGHYVVASMLLRVRFFPCCGHYWCARISRNSHRAGHRSAESDHRRSNRSSPQREHGRGFVREHRLARKLFHSLSSPGYLHGDRRALRFQTVHSARRHFRGRPNRLSSYSTSDRVRDPVGDCYGGSSFAGNGNCRSRRRG